MKRSEMVDFMEKTFGGINETVEGDLRYRLGLLLDEMVKEGMAPPFHVFHIEYNRFAIGGLTPVPMQRWAEEGQDEENS